MGKLGPGPQYAYDDTIKYKDVSEICYTATAISKRSQIWPNFLTKTLFLNKGT